MKENYIDEIFNEECLQGLKSLPDNSIDCCVTSPPYYALRDYGTGHWEGGDPNCPHYRTSKVRENTATGHKAMMDSGHPVGDAIYKSVCPLCGAIRVDEQIGLEETPEEYIRKLTEVFMEVHRVLKPEGTLWLNIGDSYVSKPKSNYNGKGQGLNDMSYGTGDTTLGYKEQSERFKALLGNYKNKDLIGIPWLLAFSLRNAGWYLRQDIIWEKGNPMPEPVKDRCVKSHEYIFLMSKSQRYYFDYEAIQEPAVSSEKPRIFGAKKQEGTMRNDIGNVYKPTTKIKFGGNKYGDNNDKHFQTYSGKEWQPQYNEEMVMVRNKRDVWSVNVKPDSVAHFATYPEELITPCILAGCPSGGVVLDPFMGSGTTARVARKLNRHYVGFELNAEYCKIIEKKIQVEGDLFY